MEGQLLTLTKAGLNVEGSPTGLKRGQEGRTALEAARIDSSLEKNKELINE